MTRGRRIILGFIIFACLPLTTFAKDQDSTNLWMASYDTVWQTVNENHYDSTFGGLDRNEIHDRYYDLITDVKDDSSFIDIVTRMLHELKLSHYAVFQMKDKTKGGSPMLSSGGVGIDLRLIDNQAFVKSVKPGLPAALSGLKPGYIIESIDGDQVDRIIAEARVDLLEHYNERQKHSEVTDAILGRFFGEPGTSVAVTYRDKASTLKEQTIELRERTGKTVVSDLMPPFYVDFVAKRIEGDIGYVSFDAFMPPMDERFSEAIDSMMDVRGLIIDIRGNPGGMHEVGEAMVSRLLAEETMFSVFRYRNETEEVMVAPSEPVYDGPVVVMIDVMNASASERFSACIQSIGRATIIGVRSQGSVGPSNLKELPNGASFMYLIAQSTTPDGTILEGHGVIPDITVGLDREALLTGTDTQLERAIEYIWSESK